jgi:hypothetical protein
MHANSTPGKEKKNGWPGLNRSGFDHPALHRSALDHKDAMCPSYIPGRDAHSVPASMDRLYCATLTERVVGFLERYDKSVCSFG